MQEVIYNSKLNLSEHYPAHLFINLIKVFPRLNSLIPKNTTNNSQPILIDKFLFYRMVLEKIKNYFELSESFVISESIAIILKDIRNREKEKITKIKTEFPLINNNNKRVTHRSDNSIENHSNRNYSPKNSRGMIMNSPKNNSEIRNNNKEKNINQYTPSVNKIYLNLEKTTDAKMKLVHFMDMSGAENNKSKALSKKSNLKNTNNNNRKVLNMNNTSLIKTISDNIDLKENKNKKKLLIQTRTEYSLKFKSPENKRTKFSEPRDKYEVLSVDTINNIYEKNLNNFINIDEKNFNIFEFENKVGKEYTLLLIGKYIFNYFKFGEIINQTKYDNWVQKIAKGYNRKNFYHHDLHAADIAHTSYIFFRYGLIHEIAKLDIYNICSVIMSCICHDYKHPGVNNNYIIETNNDIALNYNDISVLENMHISEALKLMHVNPNYDVFEGMDKEKYKQMRKQMILCVLSTDISKHNMALNFLNKFISKENKVEDIDKQDYMNFVVHTADISNPTKIFDIYFRWAKLVVEEFYAQGDKEKKLGLICSCDRTKVTIYKNQLGFIDFVELPYFSLVAKAFPKLDYLVVNLNNNKQKIKALEEEDNNKNTEKKN